MRGVQPATAVALPRAGLRSQLLAPRPHVNESSPLPAPPLSNTHTPLFTRVTLTQTGTICRQCRQQGEHRASSEPRCQRFRLPQCSWSPSAFPSALSKCPMALTSPPRLAPTQSGAVETGPSAVPTSWGPGACDLHVSVLPQGLAPGFSVLVLKSVGQSRCGPWLWARSCICRCVS